MVYLGGPVSVNSRLWREQFGSGLYNAVAPLPPPVRLREYERMKDQDVTIRFALDFTADLAAGYVAGLRHPDPEVDRWLQDNLAYLRWERGVDYVNLFREWFRVSLWAGFAVGEVLYRLGPDGRVWLDDLVVYHPATILIKLNRKGRIAEGDRAADGTPCGFWQQSGAGPAAHLPLWKVAWMAHNVEFGNYYGKSLLDTAHRWFLIERVVTDMMVDALDLFGNPWVAIQFHDGLTQERKTDPNTGQERQMSVRELIEAQVEENKMGGRNVLLLGYTDPQMKPEVQVLTTGNNVGGTFIDVIQFCDARKLQSFLMPFSLINYEGEQDSRSVERQVELFYRGVRARAAQAIERFIAQTFLRLVRLNFQNDRLPAPRAEIREVVRPEDRVSMMQMVSGLTRMGYFNPNDEEDWQAVRSWVAMCQRSMESGDRQFIQQLFARPPAGGRPPGSSRPQDAPRGSV